jgi:hypothetical protein
MSPITNMSLRTANMFNSECDASHSLTTAIHVLGHSVVRTARREAKSIVSSRNDLPDGRRKPALYARRGIHRHAEIVSAGR